MWLTHKHISTIYRISLFYIVHTLANTHHTFDTHALTNPHIFIYVHSTRPVTPTLQHSPAAARFWAPPVTPSPFPAARTTLSAFRSEQNTHETLQSLTRTLPRFEYYYDIYIILHALYVSMYASILPARERVTENVCNKYSCDNQRQQQQQRICVYVARNTTPTNTLPSPRTPNQSSTSWSHTFLGNTRIQTDTHTHSIHM